MAKREITRGRVEAVELSVDELASLLHVTGDQLRLWQGLVPPDRDGRYRFAGPEDFRRARQRIAVLATGMPEQAVRAVEEEGLLSAYTALARDCPEGVTAHVWRSYAIVVLMQSRHRKMIDAEELAVRARLMEEDALTGELHPSVDTAKKHLRLLQAIGKLRHTGMQWEHDGLPLCMRGDS